MISSSQLLHTAPSLSRPLSSVLFLPHSVCPPLLFLFPTHVLIFCPFLIIFLSFFFSISHSFCPSLIFILFNRPLLHFVYLSHFFCLPLSFFSIFIFLISFFAISHVLSLILFISFVPSNSVSPSHSRELSLLFIPSYSDSNNLIIFYPCVMFIETVHILNTSADTIDYNGRFNDIKMDTRESISTA